MNEVVLTDNSEPIKSLFTVICMSRLDFFLKYCYCVMQSVQYIKLYKNAAGRLLLILMSISFHDTPNYKTARNIFSQSYNESYLLYTTVTDCQLYI